MVKELPITLALPKFLFVMTTEAPAHTSIPVLFTTRGTSSLTGITLILIVAGTLVFVFVRATKVNLSLSVSAPLWKY